MQGEFNVAPMDIMAKVVTILMIVIAGALPFIPKMVMYTVLILPLVILITWLFSVTGFTLDNNKLIVSRPFWKTTIVIPPNAIARLEPEIRTGLLKTMGNGGLFGYTGGFRNKTLGNFKTYATNWNNAVSIVSEEDDFRIVVTPEEPEQFILCVNG